MALEIIDVLWILPSAGIGIAIGYAVAMVMGTERIVEMPCVHGELNERGAGHRHDWHVDGKEKGLVRRVCSNPACDEIRLSKQVQDG